MKDEEKYRIKQGNIEALKNYLKEELEKTQKILNVYRADTSYDGVLKGKILMITELLAILS